MNEPGCVGYSPITFNVPLLRQAIPVLLVKLDNDTGELVRNADRICVECKPGEPGELIGRITSKIGSLLCFHKSGVLVALPNNYIAGGVVKP